VDAAMVTALVWGREGPAYSIGYCEPQWANDSGLTILFSDAPDPDDVLGPDDPRITMAHLDCLLSEHPELARGVAIARKHGIADMSGDGEWMAGSLAPCLPPRY
jgi:hypothetical protein